MTNDIIRQLIGDIFSKKKYPQIIYSWLKLAKSVLKIVTMTKKFIFEK